MEKKKKNKRDKKRGCVGAEKTPQQKKNPLCISKHNQNRGNKDEISSEW